MTFRRAAPCSRRAHALRPDDLAAAPRQDIGEKTSALSLWNTRVLWLIISNADGCTLMSAWGCMTRSSLHSMSDLLSESRRPWLPGNHGVPDLGNRLILPVAELAILGMLPQGHDEAVENVRLRDDALGQVEPGHDFAQDQRSADDHILSSRR